MTQTISTVRMRFAIGAQDSTEVTIQGKLAGILVLYPVAAVIKVQMQIESTLVGYDLHTDAGLFDANIAGGLDPQCLMLPEPLPLAGARIRLRASVASTAVVDCFALVVNS